MFHSIRLGVVLVLGPTMCTFDFSKNDPNPILMSIESTTEAVKNLAESADVLGATVKFAFTDATDVIYVDGSGDSNLVSNENKDAECTIELEQSVLDGLISGTVNPMMAFTMGQLKIDGDMGPAMKLSAMFG